jgi:hypothetical protein
MAVMERPATFEDSIGPRFAGRFEKPAAACPATSARSLENPGAFRVMRFDSVTVADTSAKAWLTIIDGENHHLEEYDLMRVHRTLWGVRSVRLFNALRVEGR